MSGGNNAAILGPKLAANYPSLLPNRTGHLNPGACTIKLFTSVIYRFSQWQGAYPRVEHLKGASLR
jgi:hypothetical protein